MRAAIFDIDGTLLDSYGVDNSMYADAVRSALGAVIIRDAWEKYAHVTDTGVLASVTYFGDGPWDRAAAAQLGWEFVAVGPKLGGLSNFGAVPPDHEPSRAG